MSSRAKRSPTRSGVALCASALLSIGCGSEPRQWLVSVATDAPVPQLGDHLLLEVLGAEASCTECLRLIGIDGPDDWPVSFGVVPRTETGTVRIRARLYRAEQTGIDGLPDSAALIDAAGRLPPIEGETRVALTLSASCFGVPSLVDQATTCDPATSALAPEPELPLLAAAGPQPAPGSWSQAASKPCAGVPEGMVCIPGGVFLLGSPRPGYVVESDEQSLPEHLVKLSPFAMDADEVTVGVVRGLLAQGKLASSPVARGSSKPDELQGACTFLGVSDGANDALPVNCISRATAEEACAKLGKRLPREAEWEYAAGNLTAETPYPWGDGGDLCAMSLIGVGRQPDETQQAGGLPKFYENAGCRPVDQPSTWGLVPGGQPKDATRLGVRNLSGSLAEWVADDFAPYADPCWQPSGTLLIDPVCKVAAGFKQIGSHRGSYWAGFKLSVRATARGKEDPPSPSPYVGFRCVMPM